METDLEFKEHTKKMIGTPFWKLWPRFRKDVFPGSTYVFVLVFCVYGMWGLAMSSSSMNNDEQRLFTIIAIAASAVFVYAPKVIVILVSKVRETKMGRRAYSIFITVVMIFLVLWFAKAYLGHVSFNQKLQQSLEQAEIATPINDPVGSSDTPDTRTEASDVDPPEVSPAAISLRCLQTDTQTGPEMQCTLTNGEDEPLYKVFPCEQAIDGYRCHYPSADDF